MTINATYIATVLNSMIRMTSPILLAALTAAICNKVKVFNIGMEGTMMAGAFFSIVANYYTHSIFLAVLAGAASGLVISAINAICIIRFKASATVVGMAMNTLMTGATTYLLYVIFGVRGVFTDSSLMPLPRINLPIIKDIPFIGKVLANLTPIDYFAILLAVGMHIFLYKTVMGYRLRAIGINQKAARSLGTKVERDQFLTVALSGILCGLGGCVLSMGSVTLFIQNITAGRGYMAMAACNMGGANPLGVLFASFFFGACQAIGNAMQNTSLKTQVTASIPYVATIVALMVFYVFRKSAVRRQKELKG